MRDDPAGLEKGQEVDVAKSGVESSTPSPAPMPSPAPTLAQAPTPLPVSTTGQSQPNPPPQDFNLDAVKAIEASQDGTTPIPLEQISTPFESGQNYEYDTPRDLVRLSKQIKENHMTVLCCSDKVVLRATLSAIQANDGRPWFESLLHLPDRSAQRRADTRPSMGETPTPDNKRFLSLEDAARVVRGDDRAVVLLIWAMPLEAAAILDDAKDATRRRRLLETLRENNMSFVIAIRDSHFPPKLKNHLTVRRNKRRSILARRRNAEDITREKARREVYNLLEQQFTNLDNLINILKTWVLREQHRSNLPPVGGNVGNSEVLPKIVDLLIDCKYLEHEELYNELVKARPDDTRDIRRVQRIFDALRLDQEAVADDEALRKQEDLARLYRPYLELIDYIDHEKDGPFEWIEIDALSIMLDRRVNGELWLEFERQVEGGKWAPDHDRVVEMVRRCIEDSSLQSEIESHIATHQGVPRAKAGEPTSRVDQSQPLPELLEPRFNFPSPAYLEQLCTLDLMALFVASFLPHLDPDEFERVMEGLLEIEQAYLDATRPPPPPALGPSESSAVSTAAPALTPPAPPAESPTLVQLWAVEGDRVLQRCRLMVRGGTAQHRRSVLKIGWEVMKHESQWREILANHRHYFVTRQTDALKRLGFIEINVPNDDDGDTLFEKLVNLQCEQATRLPARRHIGWPEVLAAQLAEGVAESEQAGLLDVWQQTLPTKRIAVVLARLHQVDPNAGTIARFAEWLVMQSDPLRSITVEVLFWLAATNHDETLRMLRRIHAQSNPDTRDLVLRVIVEHCDTGETGVPTVVSSWLGPIDRKDGSVLGAQVAARVLLFSALRSRHGLFQSLQQWLVQDQPGPRWEDGQRPGLLEWLQHAMLESHCNKLDLNVLEPLIAADRVMLGVNLDGDDITRMRRHERVGQELRARLGREPVAYPLFVGSVLILWSHQLMASGAELPASRLIERVLELPRLARLALPLLGVVTVLGVVMQADLAHRRGVRAAHVPQYEQMLSAIKSVRSALEVHLRRMRDNHGQAS